MLLLHMFAYLTVSANNFAALITSVGEDALVTFGAVRIIFLEEISEDITNTDAEHVLKIARRTTGAKVSILYTTLILHKIEKNFIHTLFIH